VLASRNKRLTSLPRIDIDIGTVGDQMPATLNDLLKKTRKGATSSFSVKDMVTVFNAIGMNAQPIKEGRSVVGIAIDVEIDGKVVEIESHKPGNYRILPAYIVFQDAEKAHEGFKELVVQRCCEVLGMPTPEIERLEKKLYGVQYDISNSGTCPVCFQVQKLEEENSPEGSGSLRVLVYHGYQRPGDGHTYGGCLGVGEQPIEHSSAGSDKLIGGLEYALRYYEDRVAKIVVATEIQVLENDYKNRDAWGRPTKVEVTLRKDIDHDFEYRRQGVENKLRNIVREYTFELKRRELIRDEWQADELPEVRFPTRQRLKLQHIIWGTDSRLREILLPPGRETDEVKVPEDCGTAEKSEP
jgi:hypothetical protein